MQKSPRRSRYPRARADLTFRPVEGQFALTDRTGLQTDRLTLLAALVWTYCDGRHAPAAIAEAVSRELPDAGDDTPARVAALLARFTSQGMLT